MITSIIIFTIAKLFSGRLPFAGSISKGNLGYLCYLFSLVVLSAYGVIINV
ncbi:MAG: hypothetical protein J6T26_06830 [Firmicutes bacterium]|nr:hypothetical protein [Bacillota bacterium]